MKTLTAFCLTLGFGLLVSQWFLSLSSTSQLTFQESLHDSRQWLRTTRSQLNNQLLSFTEKTFGPSLSLDPIIHSKDRLENSILEQKDSPSKAVVWERVPVQTGPFEIKYSAQGRLHPEREAFVAADRAGSIERIHIQETEWVQQGQTLAWLNGQPIKASMTGQVAEIRTFVGHKVNLGQPLFILSDRLLAQVELRAEEVKMVKSGQKIKIQLEEYPDLELRGRLKSVTEKPSPQGFAPTYQAQLWVYDLPPMARADMPLVVDFVQIEKENTVLIPKWVADGKSHARVRLLVQSSDEFEPEERIIVLGESNGHHVEVLSQLRPTDTIIQPIEMSAEYESSIPWTGEIIDSVTSLYKKGKDLIQQLINSNH